MAINLYKHADNNSAGGGNGSSWDLAGANAAYTEAELETFLETAVVAGDVVFVKDGTFTQDSAIDCSARDGTAVSPISLIGVKAGTTNTGANVVYSDWSRDAADRPFIDGTTFYFGVGDYYIVRNIEFQSSNALAFRAGSYCLLENCKFENDDAVAGAEYGLSLASYNRVINCEITSANCNGITTSTSNIFKYNYLHDMTAAAQGSALVLGGHGNRMQFNIFDDCTLGINGTTRRYTDVTNNTFYETDTGVSATTGFGWTCINNIMEGNDTDGFKWTTQTDCNFFWKNHGDDARCTDMWDLVDTTTLYQDYEVSTGDPLFTTAGSDFSYQDDSPNINNAMSIVLGV